MKINIMKRYTKVLSMNAISLPSEEAILNFKKTSNQSFRRKDDIPLGKLEQGNYNVSMKNIKVSDTKKYLSSASKNSSLKNIKSGIKPEFAYKLENSSVVSNGDPSEKSTQIKVIARFRPVNTLEEV